MSHHVWCHNLPLYISELYWFDVSGNLEYYRHWCWGWVSDRVQRFKNQEVSRLRASNDSWDAPPKRGWEWTQWEDEAEGDEREWICPSACLLFEPSVVWKMPPYLGEEGLFTLDSTASLLLKHSHRHSQKELISSLSSLHPVRLTHP